MSFRECWRKIFPRRLRGLQRIQRIEEDLSALKSYAESLPEEGDLDVVGKLASLAKPLLKKIDLKKP